MTTERTGPRWWRVTRRILITIVILAALLIYGVFPYWIGGVVANARTRTADRKLTETPADFGAEFKDISFQTSDGVTISGWVLPSRGKKITIIYSHGLFRSRRELLKRAVELWQTGYGALLYDGRNHGASGPARVTLGYDERLDAEGAVSFLRQQENNNDRIVLFGISMGAAAALLAAAETPDVSAVISDSSFLSFQDTTTHHVGLLHLPAFPLANELRFFIQRRGRFDGSKLNPLEAVEQLGDRPAMFIAAARDRRMPPDIAQRLYDACKSPKRALAIIDGPGAEIHGHAYQADHDQYLKAVSYFLNSALAD